MTGIVMGVLAAIIPSGLIHSCQESMFDLSYIDDTSQTEAEGLFADAGAPLAESDAFKAWGKSISEGLTDCLKADFAFDWGKVPTDCVDALHPHFGFWNATNTETWANNALVLQELGSLVVSRNVQLINPETSYWDETGKVRFRQWNEYKNSQKCDSICDEFAATNSILNVNIWYGLFATIGMGDGWTLAHAVEGLASEGVGKTLVDYLLSTAEIPMDPSSSGLPVGTRTFARILDLLTFILTPDAATLGSIKLNSFEYPSLREYLYELGSTFLKNSAPAYGVPARVVPIFLKASPNAMLGWGAVPVWFDPISGAAFTFNFVAGASGRLALNPATPAAFMETKISSIYYHEGLGGVTQHYETPATSTNNQSCGWDPDCPAVCFPTENCDPGQAKGMDGGKIPGLYFFSPKGQNGVPEYKLFILTYYLVITMKISGRAVIPVKYKGPDTAEGSWAFEGFLAHSEMKAASFYRRKENCNYPNGRDIGNGLKDSPGIDCNSVADTSPLSPFFGLALYWIPLPRSVAAPGWDPVLTNAGDGPTSTTLQAHAVVSNCHNNKFCADQMFQQLGTQFLSYGYEPHLGACVDVNFIGGLAWKLIPTPMHAHLAGHKMIPMFWFWIGLRLPAAINMDLAKLQGVPAALNGFYVFLLGQCMISLVGGVACCFCGV